MKTPMVIAHRGASAYAPENTAAAFRLAMEMGVDGIELDVHLSSDGCPVVIHDERVDRTGSGTGWVKDLSLNTLKSLDFGSWFGPSFASETILTLEEVFLLLGDWQGLLNIELKSGPIFYEGLEQKVITLVKKYDRLDNVILSSFNHYSLVAAKAVEPRIKIGLLYMAGLVAPWEYALRLGAQAIHPYFHSIIPEVIVGCNAHNIAINVFTVDDPIYLTALSTSGVHGIITNVPDVAKGIVHGTL